MLKGCLAHVERSMKWPALLQTPVVLTPLPPPPKWAARGSSSQLGSLVASPQGRAAAVAAGPAGQRPTIARRSVHGRTSTRRDRFGLSISPCHVQLMTLHLSAISASHVCIVSAELS